MTGGAQTFAFKLHAIDTLEVDNVSQIHPGPFQPAVGQPARRATIDFLAFRFHSAPLFVFAASSSGIADLAICAISVCKIIRDLQKSTLTAMKPYLQVYVTTDL